MKRMENGWVLPEKQNQIAASHASSRRHRLSQPLGVFMFSRMFEDVNY
jgi:hypothetical protein